MVLVRPGSIKYSRLEYSFARHKFRSAYINKYDLSKLEFSAKHAEEYAKYFISRARAALYNSIENKFCSDQMSMHIINTISRS